LITTILEGSLSFFKNFHQLRDGAEIPGGTAEKGGYWLYDFDLNAVVFSRLDFAPDENAKVNG
jgi:hypothetical protein